MPAHILFRTSRAVNRLPTIYAACTANYEVQEKEREKAASKITIYAGARIMTFSFAVSRRRSFFFFLFRPLFVRQHSLGSFFRCSRPLRELRGAGNFRKLSHSAAQPTSWSFFLRTLLKMPVHLLSRRARDVSISATCGSRSSNDESQSIIWSKTGICARTPSTNRESRELSRNLGSLEKPGKPQGIFADIGIGQRN